MISYAFPKRFMVCMMYAFLNQALHMQGVSQTFPICVVRPELGISELWSRGIWGPALKASNGVRVKAPKKYWLFATCKALESI